MIFFFFYTKTDYNLLFIFIIKIKNNFKFGYIIRVYYSIFLFSGDVWWVLINKITIAIPDNLNVQKLKILM